MLSALYLLYKLAHNPDAAQSAVSAATTAHRRLFGAGQVDRQAMQASAADAAMQVLRCYHHSAAMQAFGVVDSDWSGASAYGGDSGVVLRISYRGMTRTYQMDVALMQRGDSYRTAVLADNATVRAARDCELEQWS